MTHYPTHTHTHWFTYRTKLLWYSCNRQCRKKLTIFICLAVGYVRWTICYSLSWCHSPQRLADSSVYNHNDSHRLTLTLVYIQHFKESVCVCLSVCVWFEVNVMPVNTIMWQNEQNSCFASPPLRQWDIHMRPTSTVGSRVEDIVTFTLEMISRATLSAVQRGSARCRTIGCPSHVRACTSHASKNS